MANNLQWLENTFNLNVPHNHVPGLAVVRPQPPFLRPDANGSLVSHLDVKMERVPMQTVSDNGFLRGTLGYIGTNGLQNNLILKHQNFRIFPGSPGNPATTVGGVRSNRVQGTTQGRPDANFMIDRICAEPAAVELAYAPRPGQAQPSGHVVQVVGAGKILGVPWIAHLSDYNQGKPGVTGVKFAFLVDTNGNVNGDGDTVPNLVGEPDTPNTLMITSKKFRARN